MSLNLNWYIAGAFKKSGLYPIDHDAIDTTQLTPTFIKASTSSTNQKTPTADLTSSLPPSPTTSSATPKPSSAGTTCSQCGSFLGGNPLVKEGLIPESLSQLFPPVPAKPQSASSRKLVTEARVITTEDFYNRLCTKQKETIERKEEIEKRKAERIERKKEKELEKEQRQESKNKKKIETAEKKRKPSIKKTKTTVVDVDLTLNETSGLPVVDLGVCCMCESMYPDGECENVEWIECDQCERWYHQVCVGLCENESLDDVFFVCVKCCDSDDA